MSAAKIFDIKIYGVITHSKSIKAEKSSENGSHINKFLDKTDTKKFNGNSLMAGAKALKTLRTMNLWIHLQR